MPTIHALSENVFLPKALLQETEKPTANTVNTKRGTTLRLTQGENKEVLFIKATVYLPFLFEKTGFILILLHEKLLQFNWLRAVVFQLNLKYLHAKITNLLRVVV